MKTFHLNINQSPTHANLARTLKAQGWTDSRSSKATVAVDDSWLQFSPVISEILEYKHLLAAFLKGNHLDHLMPETYFIDDEIWPAVLASLESSQSLSTPWILKPSLLNNGQHIHIFADLKAVRIHFQSTQRMGGPQVLQRYIAQPQLIQGPIEGHKW